jgi:hypothetical protein
MIFFQVVDLQTSVVLQGGHNLFVAFWKATLANLMTPAKIVSSITDVLRERAPVRKEVLPRVILGSAESCWILDTLQRPT